MAGFGRTGKWFSVDHWNVVPDLISMAKGLTSAYVQLGAVGMRRHIADHFEKNVFYGGLTYNSHPLACAAALATIAVYEEDDLIENARHVSEGRMRVICSAVISVGDAQHRTMRYREVVRTAKHASDGAARPPRRRCRGWENIFDKKVLYVRALEHIFAIAIG